MKLKLYAYCVVGALVSATQALATPMDFNPFLLVDIDGQNGTTGAAGVTQANYQPWVIVGGADPLNFALYDPLTDWSANGGPPTGLSKSFATTKGIVTANLVGVGTSLGARNRGANAGGLPDLYRDFAFAAHDNSIGFGRQYVKLSLAGPGITAGKMYDLTVFNRDANFQNNNVDLTDPMGSFQAWTDKAKLGGLDGPAAWMDANVGAGASYVAAVGGVNNPIPNYSRSPDTIPDAASAANKWVTSSSFFTKADSLGVITVYGWADPNGTGSNVQAAALINGFELAAPEPASLVLFGIGLVGIVALRRKLS